jgi:hypothetical protein
MKKSIYGWSSAVPNSIDLSRVERVIDIAAGTCIWTLDFANTPEIQARGDAVQIYACDINLDFLPNSGIIQSLGITTFKQDVTKRFPEQYYGTFDLIHSSLLFFCLTEEGWNAALKNFKDLLSEGCCIMRRFEC